MVSIAERLARLEAIEATKQLKARYCAMCDADYAPDRLAALFTPDGAFDGGLFGHCDGRKAIRNFFHGVSGSIKFAAHLVLNQIIEVESLTATTGESRLIMPCTVVADSGALEARWLAAEHDDTYTLREGTWLFQTVKLRVNFYSPHLAGWA